MSLTSAQKAEIVATHKRSGADTGSPEVQVSIFTARINYLTGHFQAFKKDFHSRQGLQGLVNKRRKLLKYLKTTDSKRYYALIGALSLRDSY